ncbi:MAG: hypothetical protein ACJZ4I_03630 [Candidatus Pelagibacter sp.]
MKTYDLFIESDKWSTKWKKYFDVYDHIFERFKKKKITFVEVGILDGGSLEIWKKYFHPDSRIIGIDYNPECKKFERDGIEIFIGDQSDEKFWDKFYRKIGKVDILLDDGGHTNIQQIITTIKSVPNINTDGILMVEDTHTSYINEFGNPNKYSYINFTKKLIDDLNFKYPKLGNFKTSLNDYIYSIQYFESFVIFHINREKTYINKKVINKPNEKNIVEDFRYHNSAIKKIASEKIIEKFGYLNKYKLFRWVYRSIVKKIKYIKNNFDTKKYKKYFK